MQIQSLWQRVAPQPLTAVALGASSALPLAWAWSMYPMRDAVSWQLLTLAVGLAVAFLLVARFPIHVRHNLKLLLTTVPLYLMATMLPPALAATTAGVGVLIFQLDARKRMGLLPVDIITAVTRWTLTVLVSSMVAHWQFGVTTLNVLGLALPAAVMFVGDVVGTAFEVSGMTLESPWRLMRFLAREMIVPESVQYLIGMLGVLLAQAHWGILLFFFLPLLAVHLTFKRLKEMQVNTRLMLQDMADAIDLRDSYTGGHSRRVAEMSLAILQQLKIAGPEAELIVAAARVHDIGKVSVPEEILTKPTPLTQQERAIMETHVTIGAELLNRCPNFARGKEIVRHHHERWDGAGYPSKLKGMEIPLGARVIAVADSFDAMTSDRPYRRAFSHEKALQILREGRGTQWDPHLVDAFLATRTAPQVNSVEMPLTPLVQAQQPFA